MRNNSAVSTMARQLDLTEATSGVMTFSEVLENSYKDNPSGISSAAAGTTSWRKHQSETMPSAPEQTDGDNDSARALSAFKQLDRPPIASFIALQEWEGYVISIGTDHFTARLLDITNRGKVEGEEADIPLSDLARQDRNEMKIGSVFRWAIGYEITRERQRKRTSQIILRRLPAWRKQDLEKAKISASIRAAKIIWDDDQIS